MAVAVEKPRRAAAPTGKRRTLRQREARLGVWLMSPTLIIVLVIVIIPLAVVDLDLVPAAATDRRGHGSLCSSR